MMTHAAMDCGISFLIVLNQATETGCKNLEEFAGNIVMIGESLCTKLNLFKVPSKERHYGIYSVLDSISGLGGWWQHPVLHQMAFSPGSFTSTAVRYFTRLFKSEESLTA